MFYPTLDEVKMHKTEGNVIPIYYEIMADLETPVSAFLKLNNGGYSFLLESVEGGEKLARYSFIGIDPYKVVSFGQSEKLNPLDAISTELNKYKMVQLGDVPRFCGGAIGYLSYEIAAHFEALPSPTADSLKLPESIFMFVKTMLVFDHVSHKIKVLSFVNLDGDIDASYDDAKSRINEVIAGLSRPVPGKDAEGSFFDLSTKIVFSSNFPKDNFLSAVDKIKEYIASGEAIQVVLSQRMRVQVDVSPFEIYRVLRSVNPSPYMFFLNFKEFQIVGASPEILVRVENDIVTTRPLAGTRPRGKNAAEDLALEQELLNDEKERAEHIMLVDLARNDIGRVSEPGSVKVSELMTVEKYSHVMHLVTHVHGKLKKSMNMFDALRACFPAGTVSGAPKIRAMQIIAELEPEKRGPYAGTVGYLSFSGNMDMAISIRTMIVKNRIAYIQAGCGVVYDSIPEREYEESINKAKALLKTVEETNKNVSTNR
jgi:anthranilate synthase component I